MSLLIKKATIVDSKSPFNGMEMDILVERKKISQIAKNITVEAKNTIEGQRVVVSAGWMDVHAEFNDPGNEHKEDLNSGAKAAKNGGYSSVLISANTLPIIQTKAHVNYVAINNANLPIDVKSFAALSEDLKGQNFTELYDLHLAGALGFSDGSLPISNPDLIKRALLYAKSFGGKIVVYPSDKRISPKGVMHEGTSSTKLGLKADPSLSEEIMVARDLAIAEYCDAPIHFKTISSAKSVAQIKKAKKKGIQVTCDVAIANLIWNDSALEEFDSNFKVIPPLRSEADRKALIKGVNSGTIDMVVSNHQPQNIEEKQCEFDIAGFGQSSIETCFSLYQTHLSDVISFEKWVEVICENPRAIFDQELPAIQEQETANLTIVDTMLEWTVTPKSLASKSKNTPTLNTKLTGKVLDVIC